MRPEVVIRGLLGLYAVLGILSAGLAIGNAARGHLGSAALNAVLAVVWWILFRRLWRRRSTGPPPTRR